MVTGQLVPTDNKYTKNLAQIARIVEMIQDENDLNGTLSLDLVEDLEYFIAKLKR